MLSLGYKANLSDIQAALLLGQLPQAGGPADAPRGNREPLRVRVRGPARASASPSSGRTRRAPGTSSRSGSSPDGATSASGSCRNKGIGVAVNYRAVHLLSYYRSEFGFQPGDFPYAEAIGDRTLTLPLYPMMTDDQVEQVIEAVRERRGRLGRGSRRVGDAYDDRRPRVASARIVRRALLQARALSGRLRRVDPGSDVPERRSPDHGRLLAGRHAGHRAVVPRSEGPATSATK